MAKVSVAMNCAKKLSAGFLLVMMLTACSSRPTQPPVVASFTIYGNWCGLDHPRDISSAAAPIDELDASCMRHDYCYAEKGQFSCACDQALNTELSTKLKAGEFEGAQVAYARSAYHYFKGSPCQGVASSKAGPTRLLQNLYHNGKEKAESLYDKVLGPDSAPTTTTPAVETTDHARQAAEVVEPQP